jgi:hypothetical protein
MTTGLTDSCDTRADLALRLRVQPLEGGTSGREKEARRQIHRFASRRYPERARFCDVFCDVTHSEKQQHAPISSMCRDGFTLSGTALSAR